MPRLEGGTNNTSKIAMIVAGVVIAAGVAWYALSSQNTGETSAPVPVPSASSPAEGSPPPPPDGNTAALSEDSANATVDPNATGAGSTDATGNALGAESSAGVTSTPGAMDGLGTMATPDAMDSASESPTGQSSGGAGVTMTPMGESNTMLDSGDANNQAPATR